MYSDLLRFFFSQLILKNQRFFHMDKFLNKKISRSILPLITFLSLPELNSFNFAPQGCSFTDGSARCNFRQWTPPLLDDSFGPEPLYRLPLYNLNGTIQARVIILD